MKNIQIDEIKDDKHQKISIKVDSKNISTSSKKGMITKLSESIIKDNQVSLKDKFLRLFVKPKLPLPLLIACIRQLSVMSRAGIAINESIKEIANSNDDVRVKKIFSKVATDLSQGLSLLAALSVFKEQVGDITLALIKLGESTGNMSESLTKLAEILEGIEQNEKNFKKAIRYPTIIIISLIAAFIFVITLVVSKFKAVFDSFNSELPFTTQILIWLEKFFANYAIFLLIASLFIWTYTKNIYNKNPYFKLKFDNFVLKIYLIGNIIFYSNMSRFSLIFAELVKAGIPISQALRTAIDTISNEHLKQKLLLANTNIMQGISLTNSLKQTKIFENILIAMINAGEQSGNLDEMLKQVSEYFRQKFENIIQNISSYIEPILLCVLALFVTFLALGIFTPMWDMAQIIKV
ncbi:MULTISPECIES: type II secretion system F family protein [unclassified Campylobacter]|uniref:type II secretion system F family protein n=1 Tax=unclassified Campylobacter TaxID=2593542 RepID=UPI003D3447F3